MKAKIIRLAVVLALLVSLFAVSAPPAMAATTNLVNTSDSSTDGVVTYPTTVVVGSTIQIAGSSTSDWLLNNVPLTVKWYAGSTSDKASETVTTTPAVVTTGKATDTDPGSYTFVFKVPASFNGAHLLRVTDGVNNADATLTVATKLALSPTSGAKGTEVTVTATGFSGSTGLTIMDDTDDDGNQASGTLSTKATFSTDSTGGAVGTYSATSTQTLVAVDGKGVQYGTATAASTKVFTLKPKIELDPAEGLVSKKVTVTGTQFGTATTASTTAISTVTFGGTAMTHETTNDEANLAAGEYMVKDSASGSLVYGDTTEFTLVLKVPANSNAGQQQISVTNNAATSTSTNGKANYDVTARTVTLTPSSGSTGISVQGSASGFAGGKKGTVTATGLTTISSIDIDSSGNASFSFTVPTAFGPGEKSNTITFTDADGNTGTKSFKVLRASMTLDPVTGPPGTTVDFTGSGYGGHTTMTVTFTRPGGTAFIISTSPTAIVSDSLGNVSGSVVVPSSGTGTATLALSDGTTSKSKDFTVKAAVETVASALQNIEGSFSIVWTFDASDQTWLKYDPAAASVSDLSKLEKGKGYWINMSEAATLVFGPGIYELEAGWNLIGWLGS
ncbi:MAG: hypothetical protein QGF81_01220 [Dehalococcoidia bacterium]|nr:hypothetical protein [Dehalococcoidia bacterium]